jgi:putative Mg2+ transporter-C (MgtC) family protein
VNEWEAIVRTVAALVAGGAIGLERSYHGRAAGLRTYALVSFGSALLVAGGQYELFPADSGEVTRIIQGIVTGIGFLGAGVIVKEGFSVRGLTTAASIWCAAAIGIVLGAGSYWMGFASTLVTLVALTILRRVEDRLPSQTFVHFEVGFRRTSSMNEERLRELIR